MKKEIREGNKKREKQRKTSKKDIKEPNKCMKHKYAKEIKKNS